MKPLSPKKIRWTRLKLKKRVSDLFSGTYASAFKGHGMVFADYRRYAPGDDVRAISWPLTARTGETYIKVFEEEKGATVILAVDISASFDFGGQCLKSEQAFELVCLIAFSALKGKDKLGLLLFSDQVEHYVPPGSGLKHTLKIIKDLHSLKRRSKSTDLIPPLSFLNRLLKKRCHVFLLSDFLTSRDFTHQLKVTGLRHDMIAGVIYDPLEKHFPPSGLMHCEDPETGRTVLVDTSSASFAHSYQNMVKTRHTQIKKQFLQAGVDHFHINTQKDVLKQFAGFLKTRREK